jgi:hypothetical protein
LECDLWATQIFLFTNTTFAIVLSWLVITCRST